MEASFEHHQDLTNCGTQAGKGSAQDWQGIEWAAECDCGLRPPSEASEEDCKEAANVGGYQKENFGGTEGAVGEGEGRREEIR